MIVLMIVAPQLAVDIGFALSVSATGALIVVAPIISARLTSRGWPKPLADALSIALSAQLVTAPLVAAISGQLSLVAVLANLAVAPIIPPITVLGTAAAALCPLWPTGADLLIRFTGPEPVVAAAGGAHRCGPGRCGRRALGLGGCGHRGRLGGGGGRTGAAGGGSDWGWLRGC